VVFPTRNFVASLIKFGRKAGFCPDRYACVMVRVSNRNVREADIRPPNTMLSYAIRLT
jgi:hypothetical protein